MPRTQKTTRIIKRVGFCLRWRLRPCSIIQRLLRETRSQLLEHPRFLSGVDVWPLGWCGLVLSHVNTEDKKFYNQKD